MAGEDISLIVKGIIETQIILALNNAPDAIEKLVKAALSQPVDETTGRIEGYGRKLPYLDFIMGSEIRAATETAVRKIIKEHTADIEAAVRKGLNSDSVVAAIVKSITGAADEDWRINVTFAKAAT